MEGTQQAQVFEVLYVLHIHAIKDVVYLRDKPNNPQQYLQSKPHRIQNDFDLHKHKVLHKETKEIICEVYAGLDRQAKTCFVTVILV